MTDSAARDAKKKIRDNSELDTPADRYSARLNVRTSAAVLLGKLLQKEQENFNTTIQNFIDHPNLIEAASLLVSSRRRYIAGEGKSRAWAALLTTDLAAGLSNVFQIDDHSLRALDVLTDVRNTDTLVCFSFRRYQSSTLLLAENFVRLGGRLVVVTDSVNSPIASLSSTVITVSTDSESYADSPTAISLACHLISTLTTASAKGSKRRLTRRDELSRALNIYVQNR